MSEHAIQQSDARDRRLLDLKSEEVVFTCDGDYGQENAAFGYDQIEAIFYETAHGQLFVQVEGEVFSIRCQAEDAAAVTATEYLINRARQAWGQDPIELK